MKIFKKVIAGFAALAVAVGGISFGALSLKDTKAAAITFESPYTQVPDVYMETLAAIEYEYEPQADAWKDYAWLDYSNDKLAEWHADADVYLKVVIEPKDTVTLSSNSGGDDYDAKAVYWTGNDSKDYEFQASDTWANIARIYRWNNDTNSMDFESKFTAASYSKSYKIVAFVPLSSVPLTEGKLTGNFGSCHCKNTAVKSLEIVKFTAPGLIEYNFQNVVIPEPNNDGIRIFTGTWDLDNASEFATIKIEYTTTGAWGGFALQSQDWSKKFYDISQENAGSYSVELKIKDLKEIDNFVSADNMLINAWNGCTVTSFKIKNAKANEPVYKELVNVSGVTLDESEIEFTLGSDGATPATVKLTPTVNPQDATDKTVTWDSEHEEVATVKDGVVTPVGVGTTDITVTTTDGNKTAVCTVTVNPVKPTKIEIAKPDSTTVKGGAEIPLSVTVTPANALDKTVIWSSNPKDVATVDINGTVTFANVSDTKTVTITATSKEDPAVKDSVVFTVEKLVISNPVTGVTISADTLEIAKGESGELTATVAPADADLKTVTWASSNEDVATVAGGVVTGVGIGTAKITVETVDGKKTAVCEVTVTAPKATSVTVLCNGNEIEDDKISVMEGRDRELTASAAPSDAEQKFTYKSSDEAIVKVDENGKLTAVAVGKANVTVAADGASTVIEVTVTAKSNVPYDTAEGVVIFDGSETTEGKWNPVAQCQEYYKYDGSLDFSIITEDKIVKAYYECSKEPLLILQKYNDDKLNWIKVKPYLTENGVAYYSYEDMVEAFGDLSNADALWISDDGAVLTVTKVVVAEVSAADGSVTVEGEGELKPQIDMSKSEVLDALSKVLTEEQLEAVKAGTADLRVVLKVVNINDTVSQDEKDLVAEAIKGIPDSDKLNYTVMDYLDIKLGAVIDGEDLVITETDGVVTVSVAIDKALKGTYKVVGIHDGVATVIDSELNSAGTRLTFSTNKFSTYAIIYTDVSTGDSSQTALIVLLAIACAALAATVIVKKAAKEQ